jgi:hypothetical protein
MSKHRQVGVILKKKENGVYLIIPLVVKIVDIDPDPRYKSYSRCMLNCGDERCMEWANCEIMENGLPTGKYCYHISDCEMEDVS